MLTQVLTLGVKILLYKVSHSSPCDVAFAAVQASWSQYASDLKKLKLNKKLFICNPF